MWIHDNTVNAAFGKGSIFKKECETKKEAEEAFDKMSVYLKETGHEIKLKEL